MFWLTRELSQLSGFDLNEDQLVWKNTSKELRNQIVSCWNSFLNFLEFVLAIHSWKMHRKWNVSQNMIFWSYNGENRVIIQYWPRQSVYLIFETFSGGSKNFFYFQILKNWKIKLVEIFMYFKKLGNYITWTTKFNVSNFPDVLNDRIWTSAPSPPIETHSNRLLQFFLNFQPW